jgi:hypothetical protein
MIRARFVAAMVVAVAAFGAAACTSPEPDRVLVDEGRVPPEATATTAAPSAAPDDTTATSPPSTIELGPPALTDGSLVTTAGIDDVAFGMSVTEAEQAAGSPLVALDGADPDSACYRAAFEEGPLGLELTVVDDTVERLDVTDGVVTTRSGAGIGDTTAQLEELFADQLEPGVDPDGSGEVLTYVPADESDRGTLIIFEIGGGTVTTFRAGRTPVVSTGC